MFKKGDYVVYGTHGVCAIEGVEKLQINPLKKDCCYYILKPLFKKDSVYYLPTDCGDGKLPIKKIVTKEQAEELILRLKNPLTNTLTDTFLNETELKAAIKEKDRFEIVDIIKLLQKRKSSKAKEKKKLSLAEERYLKVAKEMLFEELAFALQVDIKQVEEMIV